MIMISKFFSRGGEGGRGFTGHGTETKGVNGRKKSRGNELQEREYNEDKER